MTVCVAAIANSNVVIGASDRMISTPESAFEPDTKKIWQFTSAIFGMISGDSALQSEILALVQRRIDEHVAATPTVWLEVKEVADFYLGAWQSVRSKRAELALLSPVGLTMGAFVENQRTLDPTVADKLTQAVVGYQVPYISCIVAGCDVRGAHIWLVENGASKCHDAVGFAAIGAGAVHANSQMMLAQHAPTKPTPETLVSVHLAKKRAEVSPSVGAATDMVLVGPELGAYATLSGVHLDALDASYRKLQKTEARSLQRTYGAFQSHLDKWFASTSLMPQEPDN